MQKAAPIRQAIPEGAVHSSTASSCQQFTPNAWFQLQRSVGNQAMMRILKPIFLQTKLAISTPGDQYEQEADRIAEQVTRMPLPHATPRSNPTAALQRKCACGGTCDACQTQSQEEDAIRVQLKAVGASGASNHDAPSIVHEVLRSPGQPLDAETRGYFESRFGQNFGEVRMHTGRDAAKSAEALHAMAYAHQSHIVFASGRYQPHTAEGRSLIAHELVHTIQQNSAAPSGSGYSSSANAGQQIFRKPDGSHRGAWVTEEPAGGCGVCYGETSPKPHAAAGTVAHQVVQAAAQSYFGAYARPELPFSSPNDENGRLDLLVATKGGFKIAEIKPSNPQGEKDGVRDIQWYKDKLQETYPHMTVELLDERIPVGQGLEMPDPVARASGCPPQKLAVAPMRLGVYGYWCAPPFSQLRRICSCRRRRRRKDETAEQRKTKQASKEAAKRVRVYVEGVHPYFHDYANNLPYMEAPVGHEFVVVIDDSIYQSVVKDAESRQLQQTQRLLRPVDPREVPIIQVEPALVTAGILVAPFVAAAAIAVIVVVLIPATPELVGVAATVAETTAVEATAVEATAVTTTATTTAVTSTIEAPPAIAAAVSGGAGAAPATAATTAVTSAIEAPPAIAAAVSGGAGAAPATAAIGGATTRWAATTLSKAAAIALTARIVAGGASEAQAAELVKPLEGKRIMAIADVTKNPALANAKPGQEITIGGQTFHAVIRLTSRKF